MWRVGPPCYYPRGIYSRGGASASSIWCSWIRPTARLNWPRRSRAPRPLVAGGGLLVLEHATRDEAPDAIGDLERTRDRVQGDSALTFYRVKQPERA